jgi:hypothetical protein
MSQITALTFPQRAVTLRIMYSALKLLLKGRIGPT